MNEHDPPTSAETAMQGYDVESISSLKDLPTEKSTMLAATDDPFAHREGKALLWRNVNMTLAGKNNSDPDIKLLDGVWGGVPEQKTTAIMGPSGAGKTSLLNILAGRAASRGRVTIDAEIRLNNYIVDPKNIDVRQTIAFVAQDDSLQVTSTPREAIYFSAKLRLPRNTEEHTLINLTNKMIEELGLESCADTYIGGALLKGISGGERKRTSIGVELVVKPSMVFLDEPTSGLDSFSAMQVCRVLQKVAQAGSSVLFTIHQPASDVFNGFDQLILLKKGRVMYQGPTLGVGAYFEERGHPLPPNYNPADWIMNVAQSVPIDELNQKGFFLEDERNLPVPGSELCIGWKDEAGNIHRDKLDKRSVQSASVLTQVRLLYLRELKNITRNKGAVGGRFGLTFAMAILIGVIFLDVGNSDKTQPQVSSSLSTLCAVQLIDNWLSQTIHFRHNQNLQSHFGALVMVVIMSMMGTAQPALLAFPEERPVFLREYSTNHYSVVSYFLSRLTIEALLTAVQVLVLVVIDYFLVSFQSNFGLFYIATYALAMTSTALAVLVGCAVEDPKMGQEMLPLLFVPQFLFAGFFVIPALIPVWLRWARYLCSLTYAIRIIAVEEFGNGCGSPEADKACLRTNESIEADSDELWWNWLILIGLFVVFRLLALAVLRQKALKFF